MNNKIRYYDKSVQKYVSIDRKTGFSSYQSVDEIHQQNKTSKQLFRHNSKNRKTELKIHRNSDANALANISIEDTNKRFEEAVDEDFVCANSSTKTESNNRVLDGFGLTSDMRINSSIKLDKCLLSDGRLRVIGQMDRKLIVCLATDRNLLLAFDQHAVHERIRYEALLNQVYDNNRNVKTVPVLPPIAIALDSYHLECDFDSYQKSIKTLIGYELQRHKNLDCGSRDGQSKPYSVTRIPKCLSDSFDLESIEDIIKEAIIIIKDNINELNNFKSLRLTPKVVERLQTKACKGAIRFGDILKLYDCLKLMKSLSKCKNCYRCAHGRSSVAPLAYLPKENSSDSDG